MSLYLWTPERVVIEEPALLARIEAMTYRGYEPCAPAAIAMLNAISHLLLNDPQARRAPQYVALGYWLRPAAMRRMCDELVAQATRRSSAWAPRGVALHLPPTNVDTIFVYSWALSVLAGNTNVVRLATTLSSDAEWLVRLVARIAIEHGEGDRQIFCAYPYGGELEKSASRLCDLRMIWGGDAKVEAVSRIPVRPDGLSIGFPDRKSLALIRVESYEAASEAERDDLANRLFNDIYWFDQMGCGSPRLIVWEGQARRDLTTDLYARLSRIVAAKKYLVETGVAIGKFALANDLLAEGLAERLRFRSNELCVYDAADPGACLQRVHGGGFLGECFVEDITDIAAFVTRNVQTLTHFGFERDKLDELARRLFSRGGYRIVPIGQALQFDTDWDGVELLAHMTRRIVVRT
jgi:hypothetical protein